MNENQKKENKYVINKSNRKYKKFGSSLFLLLSTIMYIVLIKGNTNYYIVIPVKSFLFYTESPAGLNMLYIS